MIASLRPMGPAVISGLPERSVHPLLERPCERVVGLKNVMGLPNEVRPFDAFTGTTSDHAGKTECYFNECRRDAVEARDAIHQDRRSHWIGREFLEFYHLCVPPRISRDRPNCVPHGAPTWSFYDQHCLKSFITHRSSENTATEYNPSIVASVPASGGAHTRRQAPPPCARAGWGVRDPRAIQFQIAAAKSQGRGKSLSVGGSAQRRRRQTGITTAAVTLSSSAVQPCSADKTVTAYPTPHALVVTVTYSRLGSVNPLNRLVPRRRSAAQSWMVLSMTTQAAVTSQKPARSYPPGRPAGAVERSPVPAPAFSSQRSDQQCSSGPTACPGSKGGASGHRP